MVVLPESGKSRIASANGTRKNTICVVDPQASDYGEAERAAGSRGDRFQIIATPTDALRLARSQSVDLWVIHSELPGVSGAELCGMLRDQGIRAAISLVADKYSPETERAAYLHRATTFCCKAGLAELVESWRVAREEKCRGPLKACAKKS